jgi:hypothetical protein
MIRRTKDESRASHSHLAIPSPRGLEYLPYQRAGIEYILKAFGVLKKDDVKLPEVR